MKLSINKQVPFLMVAAIFFLGSCSEKRPEGILSEKQMVPLLKEMQIAAAGVNLTIEDAEKRKKKYNQFNRAILEKFEVSPEVFFESFKYYQSHPELLDSIYMWVIDELNMEMIPLQESETSGQPAPADSR